MSIVNLQGYKVDRIDFISTMENGSKITLGNKFSYNVQYAKDRNIARGEFDLAVFDKDHPEKFGIHVVVVGIFAFDPNEKKEAVHTESFKTIFPYTKALITTITANCGIKPILIPNIDIDNQEIYRIDNTDND